MNAQDVAEMAYVEELRDEQRVLDRASELLRAKTAFAQQAHHFAASEQAAAALFEMAQQVVQDAGSEEPIMVGRLDRADGEVLRVGRRLVRDEEGDVLVCSWQAPAVAAFYRATPRAPLGVQRRRTYQGRRQLLTGFSDEHLMAKARGLRYTGHLPALDVPTGVDGGPAPEPVLQAADPLADLRGHDALLDDLDRSRDGRMRDIVATIQSDQYDLITEDGGGVLVVQGGPGSGKTAVALHRASYLLYNDPRLTQQGLLVLGPNATFMSYVAQVLPGLAQTTVTQWSMQDMVGAKAGEADGPEREALLGDLRWVSVLDRLVRSTRRLLPRALEVDLPRHTVVVTADEQLALLRRVEATATAHNTGAKGMWEALVRLVAEKYHDSVGRVASMGLDIEALVRQDKGLRRASRSMWPEHTAAALLTALLSDLSRLLAASDGTFADEELFCVWRPDVAEVPLSWTPAELYLLDELRRTLEGSCPSFGHVIVDEAQELLPMAVRAVAHRAAGGAGMTLLGDLAQAGPAGTVSDWQALAELLDRDPVRIRTLTRGYRVPSEVLDLANRLIPLTGSSEALTTSIRSVPGSLTIKQSQRPNATAVTVAKAKVAQGSVAIIVTAARSEVILDRLVLPPGVQLHDPRSAKGLEFDAVVVVEPAEFLVSGAAGARELYVAMTRCTKSLTLVHAQELPLVLAAGASPAVPGQRQEPLSQERAMKHLLDAIAQLALRRGMTLSGDDFLDFRASPAVHEEALALLDPVLRARVVAALSN